MHQSLRLVSHLSYIFLALSGVILIVPSSTTFRPASAISLMRTHHCGVMYGSMTSLVFSHKGMTIAFGSFLTKSPNLVSSSTTVYRALNLFCPLNGPAFSLRVPSSFRMLTNSRLWLLPSL